MIVRSAGAAKGLGKVAPGCVRSSGLICQRRVLRDGHIHAGADQRQKDRRSKRLEVMVVDLIVETAIAFGVGSGHATDLQG